MTSTAQPPIVLLVEDEPFLRALIARGLALSGYQVLEAESGATALDCFTGTEHVAVVVTDTWMPGRISGPELIRRIRALRPGQPILRISGVPDDALGDDLPVADVPFLPKPFEHEQLLGVIEQLIREHSHHPA